MCFRLTCTEEENNGGERVIILISRNINYKGDKRVWGIILATLKLKMYFLWRGQKGMGIILISRFYFLKVILLSHNINKGILLVCIYFDPDLYYSQYDWLQQADILASCLKKTQVGLESLKSFRIFIMSEWWLCKHFRRIGKMELKPLSYRRKMTLMTTTHRPKKKCGRLKMSIIFFSEKEL
jgi:hypothetical protein